MPKLLVNIDSTSLGDSSCILKFYRTVIGSINNDNQSEGGYKSLPNASMMYGVAVHKFIDTMYRTNAHYPTARVEAERVFNSPKEPAKEAWLDDPRHLITTCYNIWTNFIEQESGFDVLQITRECWWCKGSGHIKMTPEVEASNMFKPMCCHCRGEGLVEAPATELTFKLKIYEDDFMIVNLCGTLDRSGKFKGGCFAIRDWKSTRAFRKEEYLSDYELSRQLRIYTLACKLMAERHPDSILGKMGSTQMGACIDGIFIKPKPNDVEFIQGDVMVFKKDDLDGLYGMIIDFCAYLSNSIQKKHLPKQGILNGTCSGRWGKCAYWHSCKSAEQVSDLLLKRDFSRKIYDPLAFND